MPGNPTRPATEAVFTIAPPPLATMWASSCFMHSHTPLRLMDSTRSQLSSAHSAVGACAPSMPALL